MLQQTQTQTTKATMHTFSKVETKQSKINRWGSVGIPNIRFRNVRTFKFETLIRTPWTSTPASISHRRAAAAKVMVSGVQRGTTFRALEPMLDFWRSTFNKADISSANFCGSSCPSPSPRWQLPTSFISSVRAFAPYLVSKLNSLMLMFLAPTVAWRSPWVSAPSDSSRLATAAANRRSPPCGDISR